MRRINARTVELTEAEDLIKEIHDLLMDQGYDPHWATDLILGSSVPPYLRTGTPTLDAVVTPEFIAYLREGKT